MVNHARELQGTRHLIHARSCVLDLSVEGNFPDRCQKKMFRGLRRGMVVVYSRLKNLEAKSYRIDIVEGVAALVVGFVVRL